MAQSIGINCKSVISYANPSELMSFQKVISLHQVVSMHLKFVIIWECKTTAFIKGMGFVVLQRSFSC